jgi:hypothetical protein
MTIERRQTMHERGKQFLFRLAGDAQPVGL